MPAPARRERLNFIFAEMTERAGPTADAPFRGHEHGATQSAQARSAHWQRPQSIFMSLPSIPLMVTDTRYRASDIRGRAGRGLGGHVVLWRSTAAPLRTPELGGYEIIASVAD